MFSADQKAAMHIAIDERIAALEAMIEEAQTEISTLEDSKETLDAEEEPQSADNVKLTMTAQVASQAPDANVTAQSS